MWKSCSPTNFRRLWRFLSLKGTKSSLVSIIYIFENNQRRCQDNVKHGKNCTGEWFLCNFFGKHNKRELYKEYDNLSKKIHPKGTCMKNTSTSSERRKKDKHWFFYWIRLDFGKDLLPAPALEQLLSRVEVTFQAVWQRWNIIKITLYIAQRKWWFARTPCFCCLQNDCKKNSNPTALAKLQENVRLCTRRSGKAHRKKDHPNSAPFSLRLGQSFARSPKKNCQLRR